ncbi:hypothetical protein C1645_827202 [Glomus cerebriforme]|uniref:Uncharacterized protein n=1 Tax=Glomus cerebriforme TaxID=658196 RepID=A0A397SNQ3_9GLOM|nr:hypothetical protein C1645_827202 [Glomus cerebriforme]
MDVELDKGIHRPIQNSQNNHSLWNQRQESNSTSISFNFSYHGVGHYESSMAIRLPTFQENDASRTNQVSREESGTFSIENHGNGTNQSSSTSGGKFDILCPEGKDCQIHVRNVGSLRTNVNGRRDVPEQQVCCAAEGKLHEDTEQLFEFCPNERTIIDLQTSIGKLRRIGTLENASWTKEEIRPRKCNFVLANHKNNNSDSNGIVSKMSTSSDRDESERLRHHLPMVVDSFVNEPVRRDIATSIGCKLPIRSDEPEKLTYYMMCVAKYGFEHIIFIGEMIYGIVFLDCYGRVFQYEDMCQVLWPLGESLEEVRSKLKSNKQEDQVVWIAERDGIIYEIPFDLPKPEQTNTNAIKGKKNKRSKKKKHN